MNSTTAVKTMPPEIRLTSHPDILLSGDGPKHHRRGLNPETAIQIGIMNFLRRMMDIEDGKRFMAFHVPNGGQRSREEAKILHAMGVLAGVADIILLLHGRTVFIELKHQPMRVAKQGQKGAIVRSAAKPQEDAQKAFQRRAAVLGHDYRLIAATDAGDGLNQVLAVLAEYDIRFKGA